MGKKEIYKDEKKIRLIGIPLIGMLIPAIFIITDGEFPGLKSYLTHSLFSTFFTFVYWQGNFTIFGHIERKFSEYNQVKKRILWMIISTIFYNILVASLLTYILSDITGWEFNFQRVWNNFLIGMTFTMIISTIYESIFY